MSLWATSTITTSPPYSDPNGPIPVSIFAIIRRGDGIPHWYELRELNPYQRLRRPLLYPLS